MLKLYIVSIRRKRNAVVTKTVVAKCTQKSFTVTLTIERQNVICFM